MNDRRNNESTFASYFKNFQKKLTKFYLFLFLLLVRSSIDDKMYIETYLLNDLENNIVNKP